MPAWPTDGSLPIFTLQEGYQEGFRSTVLRSQVSTGHKKRRRRFTDGPKPLNIVIPLTGAELTTFRTFYEDDLADGSLSFTKTHPRVGGTVTLAFTKDLSPPTVEGGDNYLLELPLEIIP